jgi:hypothetical protein
VDTTPGIDRLTHVIHSLYRQLDSPPRARGKHPLLLLLLLSWTSDVGWQLPLSHTLPGKTKAQCQSHCNIVLFSIFYETAMSMSIAQKLHRRKQDLVSPTHGHGSPLPNVVLDESKSAYQHPNKKSTFLKGKDECVAFSFAQVNRDITPITSRVELIGSTKLDIILFDAFPLQTPPNTLKMLSIGSH